jgi:hypothetical protein
VKSVEFCYWLQGFFEIAKAGGTQCPALTGDQVGVISKHLDLVFIHEIDGLYPKGQQEALNKKHGRPPGDGKTQRC